MRGFDTLITSYFIPPVELHKAAITQYQIKDDLFNKDLGDIRRSAIKDDLNELVS